jgi:hypothetical protein
MKLLTAAAILALGAPTAALAEPLVDNRAFHYAVAVALALTLALALALAVAVMIFNPLFKATAPYMPPLSIVLDIPTPSAVVPGC